MGLKGYTFDRMKISPKADALLYYFLGHEREAVVADFKDELKVVATGLNIYISPGACVVQGRLIEVDEEMQLSVSANDSGYVCVVIDLTQNNTSTGEAGTPDYQPVNNQIRLEVVKELVQQDLHNGGQLYTFPLASFVSNGTTVTLTKSNVNPSTIFSGSIETKNGILWDTGLLHFSANKGNLTSGAFWTNIDNFPKGMSYTFITDTNGYTNAPFTNASYIVMGDGYFFSVLALQMNGTGIKYLTGISSSTGLSWQTVKS